ncbi:hypothetical protein DID88_008935 [Monilinia fructigena]|uniref:O-methyltransferase domain-containing protein n=1 Tax=Monilinia fructigena TaxID=38457 RepID=A0A395J6V5_9HELO|nr:hypothetical protein DID88_008935 [Monilinia fructigena]
MGPDSAILIDDMVISETGAHWHATQIDVVMMTVLASTERTEEQWHALLASAVLKQRKLSSTPFPSEIASLRQFLSDCGAIEIYGSI